MKHLKEFWDKFKVRCRPWMPWLRYAYFLRFSILLWIFPPLLVGLNCVSAPRALISGIVTPTRWVQYLCVAFFLIASSLVSLMLARIVIINGKERFHEEPPKKLTWLFANKKAQHEWVALLASLANSVGVFVYFFVNGVSERVQWQQIAVGLAAGCVVSAAFWYAVNAFYYLTYHPPAGEASEPGFGKAAARTMLFPRSWMLLSQDGTGSEKGDVLEDASSPNPLRAISWIFPVAGYRWPPDGNLYDGHHIAIVAVACFYSLFWVLYPLTAPEPLPHVAILALILYLLDGLVFIVIAFRARPGRKSDAGRLRIWKLLIGIVILFFAATIPLLYFCDDAERFPIFALVLILVTSCIWTLGAIAFFADRFRVPVITCMLVGLFVPRMFHLTVGREEHYLSTTTAQTYTDLPAPADILNDRLTAAGDHPLFIVTATGGGIHAAAWTTAVLRNLEIRFQVDPSLGTFHDHVLLLSTVSGGSNGLYDYLRELDPIANGGKPDWGRMVTSAQCSSLEAVGWGLVYYDIPKAFVPFVPFLSPLSKGDNDLGEMPLAKDRTWSLRRAFARNLGDPYCLNFRNPGALIPLWQVRRAEMNNRNNESELTLRRFITPNSAFPAFTMNTTTVENGERFLLANYRIPAMIQEDYRARSFLATYSNADNRADLPLATAAQMSATFPVVSSAGRVPWALDPSPAAVHFVDGGYYDNDGTASAIEFLKYALISPAPTKCESGIPAGKSMSAQNADKSASCPLRIVLIEIRNSGDVGPSAPESTPDHSDGTHRWNLDDQALAPVEAFMNAGHESVTGRNRVTLALLEEALAGKVQIRHIVISDDYAKDRTQTDPLSWSLTPEQQGEVWGSANKVSPCYDEVMNWFMKTAGQWNQDLPAPEPACVPRAVANNPHHAHTPQP